LGFGKGVRHDEIIGGQGVELAYLVLFAEFQDKHKAAQEQRGGSDDDIED